MDDTITTESINIATKIWNMINNNESNGRIFQLTLKSGAKIFASSIYKIEGGVKIDDLDRKISSIPICNIEDVAIMGPLKDPRIKKGGNFNNTRKKISRLPHFDVPSYSILPGSGTNYLKIQP